MNKTFKKTVVALLIASLFVIPMSGINGGVQAQNINPASLEPYLSADGEALYKPVAPLILRVNPNPAMQGIKIPPAPELEKALADPAAASATFSITYVAAGGTDIWSDVCTTFPENAKTALNAATDIWASTIQSSVPITIQACWSTFSDPNVIGGVGTQYIYHNFSGAPQTNTWYESSLANALHGSDLNATRFDMFITYNSNSAWYYGTDSNPPGEQFDLVTTAAHQIAYGLGFTGSATYTAGTGGYGYGVPIYPEIYDTFMEDNSGTKLTSYTNPSTALGTLLTSGSLWFNGSNANVANGGSRVKMYAPSTWSGASYSYLDYDTFAGTANGLMVPCCSSGSANHNPGPVTKGLLKDLGWVLAGEITPPSTPTGVSATDGSYTDRVSISWNASTGATYYEAYRNTSNSTSGATLLGSPSASPYDDTSATAGTTYWYFVKACNTAGCSGFSSSDSGYRSTVVTPPSAPTGVSATDGSYSDRVSISWSASPGATYYEVYRNNSNSTSGVVLLGSPSTSPYDDTTATAGTTYWYFVKACNTGGCSGFSSSDSGYRSTSGQNVYAVDVFTTDENDVNKTDFHAGDPIRLYIHVYNQFSTPQTVKLERIVLDPLGHDVPALESSSNVETPAGDNWWYRTNQSIPANSMAGVYNFTGKVTFPASGGITTSASTTFRVNSTSSKVYLPLVMRDYTVFFEGPWEMEPNNTSLQANGPLRSGRDYYGNPNDEKDYFSINLKTGGQIIINLSNHTGQDVQLQLFYQNTSNLMKYDYDAPYSIDYTGEAGWYYIYIHAAGNYNSSTAYTLQVTYP